jgi:hypothetical protein
MKAIKVGITGNRKVSGFMVITLQFAWTKGKDKTIYVILFISIAGLFSLHTFILTLFS